MKNMKLGIFRSDSQNHVQLADRQNTLKDELKQSIAQTSRSQSEKGNALMSESIDNKKPISINVQKSEVTGRQTQDFFQTKKMDYQQEKPLLAEYLECQVSDTDFDERKQLPTEEFFLQEDQSHPKLVQACGERVFSNGRFLEAFILKIYKNSKEVQKTAVHRQLNSLILKGQMHSIGSVFSPPRSPKSIPMLVKNQSIGSTTSSIHPNKYQFLKDGQSFNVLYQDEIGNKRRTKEDHEDRLSNNSSQRESDNDNQSRISGQSSISYNKIRRLMIQKKDKHFKFRFKLPKGHLANLIYSSTIPYNPDTYQSDPRPPIAEFEQGLIQTYINQRFYEVSEVKFNFWMLLYRGLYDEAIQLYTNEREEIYSFMTEINKQENIDYEIHNLIRSDSLDYDSTQNMKKDTGPKVKINKQDESFRKLPFTMGGIKWGIKNAIILGLKDIVKELLQMNQIDILEGEYLEQLKGLAIKHNCLEYFRYLYRDLLIETHFEEQSQEYEDYQKSNGHKYSLSNYEDIDFITVYQRKIKKLQTRSQYELHLLQEPNLKLSNRKALQALSYLLEENNAKYLLEEHIKNNNLRTSSSFGKGSDSPNIKDKPSEGQKKDQELPQQDEQKTFSKGQIEQYMRELEILLRHRKFLYNPNLTPKLCTIGAFEVLTEVIRERIRRQIDINKRNLNYLYIKDLESILRYWDKFNAIVMNEILLKLLQQKTNVVALTNQETQKNIIKILIVNVYNGTELLARVPISSWSNDLDKVLLNAIESHLKEPYQMIYSQKPLITFVLIIEFIEKLYQKTYKYKNRCKLMITKLLHVGKNFVSEFKTDEFLKFYADQKDSQGRSALEIMSSNKYYELLESNQMATLIKEKWHGLNSQNFGLFSSSKIYNIINCSLDEDEAKKLFDLKIQNQKSQSQDMKCYLFQYYLWPYSCSLRYIFTFFFILVLAVLYQMILINAINDDAFEYPEDYPSIYLALNLAIVWIATISLGNLLEYTFDKLTHRRFRLDYSLVLDLLLLFGIFLQLINVPTQVIKYSKTTVIKYDVNEASLRKYFNLFLNVCMSLLVWMKIGSFVITTQQFGVYIRMITHMIRVIFIFIIIWGAWIICCSQIFCLLFYKENEDFKDQYTSIISLLNASFNNFLFNFERSKLFGSYLLVLNVTMSSIFLMNMIVAVLSGIYRQIIQKTEADYNANLVIAESKMRWDDSYGVLIFVPPPLNFIIGSLLLIPIAYFKGLFLSFMITRNKLLNALIAVVWTFLGIFILFLSIFADSYNFFALTYQKTVSFKNRLKAFRSEIPNSNSQSYFKLTRLQCDNEENFGSQVEEFKNMEQLQKYGKFIGRHEILSLAKFLKIAFREENDDKNKIKKKVSKKSHFKPLNEVVIMWFNYLQSYTENQIKLDNRSLSFQYQEIKKKMTLQMAGLLGSKNRNKQQLIKQVFNLKTKESLFEQHQKETFVEFLSQLSPIEQFVDYEKLKKIIFDESSLLSMNEKDFDEYRLKLFHTNINLLDKAVNNSKHGRKANKIENKYVVEVGKNIYELSRFIDIFAEKLQSYVDNEMEIIKKEESIKEKELQEEQEFQSQKSSGIQPKLHRLPSLNRRISTFLPLVQTRSHKLNASIKLHQLIEGT